MPTLPCPNVQKTTRAVLELLHRQTSMQLWMMTRKKDDNWMILFVEDHGYDVKEGSVFEWSDSLCSKMVLGLGPRVATDAQKIPAYAQAPIGKQLPIGSYIGVPVLMSDGSLFGTLCAIDPLPKDNELHQQLEWVELCAQFIGTAFEMDIRAAKHETLLKKSYRYAHTDSLTGLLNRNGWETCIAAEQQRVNRYGHQLAVIFLDVDELKKTNDTLGHAQGDEIIRQTACSLQKTLRKSDIVARIGGDEFAVVVIECDEAEAELIGQKIVQDLKGEGVSVSIGVAACTDDQTIAAAVALADSRMYQMKAQRHKNSTSA